MLEIFNKLNTNYPDIYSGGRENEVTTYEAGNSIEG